MAHLLGWLRTLQGAVTVLATLLAIMAAWWQLGLPRVVFSSEPVPAGLWFAARRAARSSLPP
jgi:hypothetical protein